MHAEEAELAELLHELATEVLLLEVVLDDGQDALLREAPRALLPLALVFAEQGVEVEHGVDARGGGHRWFLSRGGCLEPVGARVLVERGRSGSVGGGAGREADGVRDGAARVRARLGISATGSSPSDSANAIASATSFTSPAGTPTAVSAATQWSADAAARRCSMSAVQLGAVRDAVGVRREPRIVVGECPESAEHRSASAAELLVVADRDDELAIGGVEHRVGGDARVRVAEPAGRVAGGEGRGRLVRERREQALHEVHLDELARAGAVALAQGEQDAGERVLAR